MQRPFKCEVPGCEKAYVSAAHLYRHTKVKHNSTATYREVLKYVLHILWVMYAVEIPLIMAHRTGQMPGYIYSPLAGSTYTVILQPAFTEYM